MFPQSFVLKVFKAGSCVLSNARHKTSVLTFTRILILHIEKVRFSLVSHKNTLYNASSLHHTGGFSRIQLHVKKVKCKGGGGMPKNTCYHFISWKDRTVFLGQVWSTDQFSCERNEDLFVSMTCVKQQCCCLEKSSMGIFGEKGLASPRPVICISTCRRTG